MDKLVAVELVLDRTSGPTAPQRSMPSSRCRTAHPSSHSGTPLAQPGRRSECQAERLQLHSAPSRRGTREAQSRPDQTSSNESTMRRSRLQMSVSQVSYSSTRQYRAIQFSQKRNRRLSKGEMGPFSKPEILSDSVNSENGIFESTNRDDEDKNSNIERRKSRKWSVGEV